ncbi:MAG: HAD-IIB family hydrolase, partial [Spirochaetes bacterium]|nr:HAD-IIB family hydrolase [Spirochaetota bacterium]
MKIVFSDLDGTILDLNTYSYEDSLEAVDLLKKNGVPLILVSNKTFPEMRVIHAELRLGHPFIFENGGGIAYPVKNRDGKNFKIENLGKGMEILKGKFRLLNTISAVTVKSIYDMDPVEITDRTGLTGKNIELLTDRSASLPFVFVTQGHQVDVDLINEALKTHGVFIIKGGRFYHLVSAGVDKGGAVKKVSEFIKRNSSGADNIVTVGIGDSESDISMLKAVDIPFLIRKPDGSVIKTDFEVIATRNIGPGGFTEAIKSIF